jgi:hypothetical protein
VAVQPKVLYPSQIETVDTAYPYGKAKNVAVPGDGSGTPLEQGWLNDLWGFLQALLVDAGVTPDGVADKVGASQYLASIKAVIDAKVTALRAGNSTWLATNTYNLALKLAGTADVEYTVERVFADHVALLDGLPGNSGIGWLYDTAGGYIGLQSATQAFHFPIYIPDGANLQTVTAEVEPTGSGSMTMTVARYTTVANLANTRHVLGLSPSSAGGGHQPMVTGLITTNNVHVAPVGSTRFEVSFMSSSGAGAGTPDKIHGIRYTYGTTRATR